VRSASSWSLGLNEGDTEASIHVAYMELIEKAKHFIYIENQFFISQNAGDQILNGISEALIMRIKVAARNKEKFKVVVFVPLLPGFEGDVGTASVLKVQLHWQYQTICRGEKSMYEVLKRDPNIKNPEDYISFYSLRTHGKYGDLPETEMIYIHSKLMIVDDRVVIMGSANINDRSMLGKRDSEICIVTEDSTKVAITMNGHKYQARKFAHELRAQLYQEHLGLTNYKDVADPLNPILLSTISRNAKNNTEIYRTVFRCLPDDNVTKLDQVLNFQREKDCTKYEGLKNSITGNVVEYPRNFLREEDLTFGLFKAEKMLPDEVFT